MSIDRLLTAAAALALGLALPAAAQTAKPATATAKTEAQAAAATGKATTDKPAATMPQGTAKAVKEGAAPAAGAAANVQATTAAPAAGASAAAVAPNGDLIDTLKASGQFKTFVAGVDATNLTQLLKTNKNLTVFAPTDAAFAALPAGEVAKLQSDKAAMQKFILHHVINAPVDSAKIKGARGPVPSGAGDSVLLDGSDEGGVLKADGARIVQADVRTASGLLHVVDRPLVAGQGGEAAPAAAATGSDAAAKPKS